MTSLNWQSGEYDYLYSVLGYRCRPNIKADCLPDNKFVSFYALTGGEVRIKVSRQYTRL